MGRKRIQIKTIENKKNRIDTFHKRKVGLVKKAAELSMLCGIRMLVVFEDLSGGVFRYSTHGVFEPREYFKEAWDITKNSKTKDDYPTFFEKIPKKRKAAASKPEQDQESSSSSEEEEGIEQKTSQPLSIRDVKRETSSNGMHAEAPQRKSGFVIDTLEDLDRCLGNYQFPESGALNETQELFLSIKKTLEQIKRRTSQYDAPQILEDNLLNNRRRAVTTNRNTFETRNTPSFGVNSYHSNGSVHGNSSLSSKRGTLELDPIEQRRSAFWRGELKDVICEEPEFGKSQIPMSPINREKIFGIDFIDDEYAKRTKINGDYGNFSEALNNNGVNDAAKHFNPLTPLPIMLSGMNIGLERESPPARFTENSLHSKEGNSKSDSDHSKNLEISRNNARDFWLNLSRTDGFKLDNSSILRDEYNGDLSQGVNRSSFMKHNSGNSRGIFSALENSGMMLFSPIPLTTMTTTRKNDPADWLAYSMKVQAEQAQKMQQADSHEQLILSFQSDSSIMKSPRLEKHIKDS